MSRTEPARAETYLFDSARPRSLRLPILAFQQAATSPHEPQRAFAYQTSRNDPATRRAASFHHARDSNAWTLPGTAYRIAVCRKFHRIAIIYRYQHVHYQDLRGRYVRLEQQRGQDRS